MENSNSVDVKRMISLIQTWLLEAGNFRNDGWVQYAYKERILAIHAVTEAALASLECSTDDVNEEKETFTRK
jgi:hypothetical protein